jgi:hypothetical protein
VRVRVRVCVRDIASFDAHKEMHMVSHAPAHTHSSLSVSLCVSLSLSRSLWRQQRALVFPAPGFLIDACPSDVIVNDVIATTAGPVLPPPVVVDAGEPALHHVATALLFRKHFWTDDGPMPGSTPGRVCMCESERDVRMRMVMDRHPRYRAMS